MAPAATIAAAMLANCTLPRAGHVERRGVGNGNTIVDYRWPNQHVTYYFDASWEAPQHNKNIARRNVEIALTELKEAVQTYGGVQITFEELGHPHQHALKITAENACSATVGYSEASNANTMNIGACYTAEAFVKHEIGHAVGGLWHEQQHPFATTYISKACDAAPQSCNHNCKEMGTYTATTTPYDLTSIMHYSLGGCGGMQLTPMGKALAKATHVNPQTIGAATNYSRHDAQMVAREYNDERLNDANRACSGQYRVKRCNANTCTSAYRIADGTCDDDLACYYLDGGDCDDTFKNLRKNGATANQHQHHAAAAATHHSHSSVDTTVIIAVLLLLTAAIATLCLVAN